MKEAVRRKEERRNGEWRAVAEDAFGRVTVYVYKNDKTVAEGVGASVSEAIDDLIRLYRKVLPEETLKDAVWVARELPNFYATPACPACGAHWNYAEKVDEKRYGMGARRCRRCRGVYGGKMTYGEFKAAWRLSDRPIKDHSEEHYFDVTLLTSEGARRFHGFVTEDGRITQVG